MHRERFGRAMILIVTLMMLAMPMASAQVPATPVGEEPRATEPSNPNQGDGSDTGETPDAGENPDTVDDGSDIGSDAETGTSTPPGDTSGDTGTSDEGDAGSNPETVGTPPPTEETPASTPAMRIQNRGVSIMAAREAVFTLETSDAGGVIPAGTEVCIVAPDLGCKTWGDAPLSFTIDDPNFLYITYTVTPPSGSMYVEIIEGISVNESGVTNITATLVKKATVNVTVEAADGVPDGVEVCVLPSDQGCVTWTGAMSFTAEPGTLQYSARYSPDGTTPELVAAGNITVQAGESTDLTITLQAPGGLEVTVTTEDGGVLPTDSLFCIYASVGPGCSPLNEGTFSLPFLPAGPVQYAVQVPQISPYRSVSGTIEITPGDPTTLDIVLEHKDPAKLRVYVTTEDGAPVPDGTQVCVNLPIPEYGPAVNNECQDFSGEFVTFTTGQGSPDVTVTPPEGSGYVAETYTAQTMLDFTSRVVFTLQGETLLPPAGLVFNVSLEGGEPLDPSEDPVTICVYSGTLSVSSSGCLTPDATQSGQNGSLDALISNVNAGTYNYVVAPTFPGYAAVTGTVTVTLDQNGTNIKQSIVLPKVDEDDTATLIVNVVTQDGAPAPSGTKACAVAVSQLDELEDPSIEDFCQVWSGTPLTFELPPNAAMAIAINDMQSSGGVQIVVLEPGETRELSLTLFTPEIETGITSAVSNDNPQSGDQVTYTIRAWGSPNMNLTQTRSAVQYPPSFFTVSTTLPAELTDISVSCDGTYQPTLPDGCGEIVDGVLEVPGSIPGPFFYYVTITVTGTIVGDPGTVVSMPSCLVQVDTPYLPGGTFCAASDLTIAEAPVETATVTFDLTSSDPAAASAMPAGSTWSLTGVDDPTATFSGTFTDNQLALPGSITLEEPIPFGTYTLTIDASPAFDVYTQDVVITDQAAALNLTKQGFFQQALPQVTLPIELQVAAVEPTGTPTGTPTEIPTVTPTETPTGTPATPTSTTVPSTPIPTGTPTQPGTATPAGTPGTSPVTGLPSTGHDGGNGTSLAIYAGLAVAVLLGGAGFLLRSRQPER